MSMTNIKNHRDKGLLIGAIVLAFLYQVVLIVSVITMSPDAVPSYKAILVPGFALSILPLLIFRAKNIQNLVAPAAFSYIALTGLAFQALMDSGNFSPLPVWISLFAIPVVMMLIRHLDKLEALAEKKFFPIVYWVWNGAIAVSGLAMRLLLKPHSGAYCWITVGATSIQLTEVLKVMFLCSLLMAYLMKTNEKRFFLYTLAAMACTAAAMLVVNEGGTLLICGLCYFFFLFITVEDSKAMSFDYSVLLGLAALATIAVLVLSHLEGKEGILGTLCSFGAKVVSRLQAMLPGSDADRYQANMAAVCIRTGKFFGSPSEYYKNLPVYESDFVLAALCLRLGFVVVGILLLANTFLFINACSQFSRSTRGVALMIAASAIFIQAAVVFMCNVGILSVVGLPYPLVSAGGSNMVISTALFAACFGLMGQSGGTVELREEN